MPIVLADCPKVHLSRRFQQRTFFLSINEIISYHWLPVERQIRRKNAYNGIVVPVNCNVQYPRKVHEKYVASY